MSEMKQYKMLTSYINALVMAKFRRRNAISAHSNTSEALALRTFSRLAQSCTRGFRRGESNLFWEEGLDEEETTEERKIQSESHPSTAPAA